MAVEAFPISPYTAAGAAAVATAVVLALRKRKK
ncbi:MAG: LPXTG cell wall anchor domain-containing protein [Pyrobaculum sp.]